MHLPMPMSPSSVSGISARYFRDCRSFDELWNFRVGRLGPATFKYGRAVESETQETPSTMQACSFFLIFFLEFCLSTSAFSSTILLHKFVQVFDTLKIPVHCFGTEILWKRLVAWSFRTHVFFCYAIFIWIWENASTLWGGKTCQDQLRNAVTACCVLKLIKLVCAASSRWVPSQRWNFNQEIKSFYQWVMASNGHLKQ